ncbi:hypothetical protein DFJ74DRAFT_359242 [Hyaloraphidium curvatum]|nr:hypothetical protein DFJ74DRAFT_359242 [Hyaloraphidium curvatum]
MRGRRKILILLSSRAGLAGCARSEKPARPEPTQTPPKGGNMGNVNCCNEREPVAPVAKPTPVAQAPGAKGVAAAAPVSLVNIPRPQIADPPQAAAAAKSANAPDAEEPFEFMVQSHQSLFKALDDLAESTKSKGRDKMREIRAEADQLFLLMKLHAAIEDKAYFPAVNAKHPTMADRFMDDHKNSATGRPALLALLNKAAESDADFTAAMEALRKFCAGNRAHQLAEEDVINPHLPTSFTTAEAKEVVRKIADLDFESFAGQYVPGICARLPAAGKESFMKALEASLPPDQMAAINGKLADSEFDPFEFMVQSHQALFRALDELSASTSSKGRDRMDEIRAEADRLFLLMRLHAGIEDKAYFPAVNAKHPDMADRFMDDHKNSATGRPALLALLNKAPESDADFAAAMEALRKFCAGNRAHQLAEEEVINPHLPASFTRAEAREVVRAIADVDFAGFAGQYVPGISALLEPAGKAGFLKALRVSLPAHQMAAIEEKMAEAEASPFEFMVQSHQALFKALDDLAESTKTKGRDKMPEIRAEADRLFLLMKLHAAIEDKAYFPAVNAKHAGMADRFMDDHKNSATGRPALLGLLDKAVESDADFAAAMEALRKFCAGNRAHQLAEEEVINPILPTSFTPAEAKEVIRKIVAVDPESFTSAYVPGICALLPIAGRNSFLKALETSLYPAQYATVTAVTKPARTWQFRMSTTHGENNKVLSRTVDQLADDGAWKPFDLSIDSPGFIIFAYAIFTCKHLYFFMNAAERGLLFAAAEGTMTVSAIDWGLHDLEVEFSAKLTSGSPTAEDVPYIVERMQGCPVSKNLHVAGKDESRVNFS